jgi:hypothetical protein
MAGHHILHKRSLRASSTRLRRRNETALHLQRKSSGESAEADGGNLGRSLGLLEFLEFVEIRFVSVTMVMSVRRPLEKNGSGCSG